MDIGHHIDHIVAKVTSGRWILTVATAGVFVYAVAKGMIDAATTATIVMFVFKCYFDQGEKKDQNGNGDNGKP